MSKVAQKRALRNRQNQARRMNRINLQKKLKKQKQPKGEKLTEQQKIDRSNKLKYRKEEKLKRKQLIESKTTTKNIKRIQEALSSIFSINFLDRLAAETGFLKRRGLITAFSFVYTLSFAFLGNGAKALTYLVQGLRNNFNINVTAQALSKRINSKSSTLFLKSVLSELVTTQLKIGLKNNFANSFSMFPNILLEDSTAISLNEQLSEDFKGSGGGASKSALKIQFIFDIMSTLAYSIKITSGIQPDQVYAKDVISYIQAGSLSIRDLGYFCIASIRMIQEKLGYYLTRLSVTTYVYLNKDDIEPLNVPEFLERKLAEGVSSVSVEVYVGKNERFKTRLVAEKVPSEVSKKRIGKYKDNRKKEPSDYYKEWCGFSIFITNIPESMFSVDVIIALYKIRWQIELAFANFKSNIEIDVIKGTNKHRVNGLIYGRLITIVTMYIIHNYAANLAGEREVSGDKLTKWLKNEDSLNRAIREEALFLLLITLECDLILVCKQKRTRKTTQETLIESLKMEMHTLEESKLSCA